MRFYMGAEWVAPTSACSRFALWKCRRVGDTRSRHVGVDMVSLTGSTPLDVVISTNAAPTHLLVPRIGLGEPEHIAAGAANALTVGLPYESPDLGPIANEPQYERVQRLIELAIAERGELIAGSLDCPGGLEQGYLVRPMIFSNADLAALRKRTRQPLAANLASK